THVAKMNLEQLLLHGEVTNGFHHMFSGSIATFDPGADTQADADVGTIGDRKRSRIAGKSSKDTARNAAHFEASRIVGMNTDIDAGFLGNGHDFADEIRVILPQLVFGVAAPV